MKQRTKRIATAIIIAALGTGLSTSQAWAADADEVEELQREVRQMRAQVQALVAAISESTELERQRTANFTRALQAPISTSEPAGRAPAAPAAGESKPAIAPSPAGDDRGRAAPRHRHHRSAGRSRSKDR